ncbi:hypothetical protein ACFQ1L_01600 [Phytohabitans flavus]|uniref:hypothetical protein n=1 Tax=Phytohabitans flavus TaxID=1076124 RepID=UPI003640C01A
MPTRIERGYRSRLDDLSADARTLLTIASADPIGDPALLWAAAERRSLDVPAAAAAAAATGLIEFSARTRFCHPLARSAVYRHADAAERRAAHRTLAEVTDPKTDPDRRAWHRAQAVTGPDEEVATELERAASLARSRGGMAAAAAFLERAAALSLNHASRIGRTLDAAQAHLDSGGTDTAEALLTAIENATMDTPQHARLDLLRGRISFLKSHDGSGPKFMLRAARRLDETDPRRARDYLVDAFEMGLAVGRASGVLDMILATAPATSAEPDVLDGLLVFAAKGPRAAVPLLRKLLDDTGDPLWTRRPALAVILAAELWDPDGHAAIVRRLVQTGRESGSPIVLRLGLAQTAFHAVLDGDIERAMTSIAEEEAIADATRGPAVTYHRLQLAAMRGRRDEALDLMRRPNQLTTSVHWASALLHNGLGDYPAALAAAQRAIAQSDLFLAGLALPELVEAAVRSGSRLPPRRPWTRSSNAPSPPAPRWAWASRRTPEGWSQVPRTTTARPSSCSTRLPCSRTAAGPTCCTASGYGAKAGGGTAAGTCVSPTNCSPATASTRSPNVPPTSYAPPARRPAAVRRAATTS